MYKIITDKQDSNSPQEVLSVILSLLPDMSDAKQSSLPSLMML